MKYILEIAIILTALILIFLVGIGFSQSKDSLKTRAEMHEDCMNKYKSEGLDFAKEICSEYKSNNDK